VRILNTQPHWVLTQQAQQDPPARVFATATPRVWPWNENTVPLKDRGTKG